MVFMAMPTCSLLVGVWGFFPSFLARQDALERCCFLRAALPFACSTRGEEACCSLSAQINA